MNKVQIELSVLLPTINHQADPCLERIIQSLTRKKGISDVHLSPKDPSMICIHYNPDVISMVRVKSLAKQNGAVLRKRYGHLLLEVSGIRHERMAREISQTLMTRDGIVEALASVSGSLRIEWDTRQTSAKEVCTIVSKLGLHIISSRPPQEDHSIAQPEKDHTKWELRLALISGFFWLLGSILSWTGHPDLSLFPYIIALASGGYYILIEAISDLKQGKFQIDFLMIFAAVGAVALGKFGEGALLLFLFSLGHALEHYAMKRARRSIEALSDLVSHTALVKKGELIEEKPIEALQIGDTILVKPNSKIAADGIVSVGRSSVDQSPITGESIPVDKYPAASFYEMHDLNALPSQHRVFAGSINGGGALEVTVLKLAQDSTISKLITMIREAETQKSATQHFAEKFERYYVPVVLAGVFLLMFAFLVRDELFSQSFYRAMAVLIAASPCALAISTPSAVLAGIARAAREGVLFKGGRPLENLSEISAIAFDKTGTLTEGKPKLTHVIPYGDTSREQLLRAAVAVESLSDHPLSAAIVIAGSNELNEDLPPAKELEALTARGVRAKWNNSTIHIGNRRLFEELTGEPIPSDLEEKMSALEHEGHTAMIVHQDDHFLGIVSVMDVGRKNAAHTINALAKMDIGRMIMLTGDNQQVADSVAKSVGLSEARGNLLPEDKVAAIAALMEKERGVAMVGDGVNDAPAMARCTVGIAMGAAGSDVALETADVALMGDQLDKLPFAIGLSRKARRIVIQNLWISLGMVVILVPLTLSGVAEIGPAVIAHEGSTLVVVLNALRLLYYRMK